MFYDFSNKQHANPLASKSASNPNRKHLITERKTTVTLRFWRNQLIMWGSPAVFTGSHQQRCKAGEFMTSLSKTPSTLHPCGRVLPPSAEATRGKARHGVISRWTSVVRTQRLKLWRRQQPQSGLIQMNPGLPGLFIPVGRWWLLCSAGVLICCRWTAAVLARRYQGSGIGGPTESKHRTCPLLIYPRRDGA